MLPAWALFPWAAHPASPASASEVANASIRKKTIIITPKIFFILNLPFNKKARLQNLYFGNPVIGSKINCKPSLDPRRSNSLFKREFALSIKDY